MILFGSLEKFMLPVDEVFNSIQFEGYWAGTPSTFIRLHGCPVQCPWCDEEYSDGGRNKQFRLQSIAELVDTTALPRVVITGGEPFLHQQLPELVEALLDTGKSIQIETSGSFWQNIDDRAWVTLSPKSHVSKLPVASNFWSRANEIKLVVTDGNEIEYYKNHLSHPLVFLQPEWNARDISTPLAIELAAKHNFRVSIQTHKLIDIQ